MLFLIHPFLSSIKSFPKLFPVTHHCPNVGHPREWRECSLLRLNQSRYTLLLIIQCEWLTPGHVIQLDQWDIRQYWLGSGERKIPRSSWVSLSMRDYAFPPGEEVWWELEFWNCCSSHCTSKGSQVEDKGSTQKRPEPSGTQSNGEGDICPLDHILL